MEEKKDAPKCDQRVQKTCKALNDAMFTLLEHRNFNHISINDLCSEALVSRATFYSHFRNKYELLEYLLSVIKTNIIKDIYQYDELERDINQFIYSNKKAISNVLTGASSETMASMSAFMASIAALIIKRRSDGENTPHYIVLLHFFSGGLLNLLMWIVENDFPPDIPMMDTYLYQLLKAMTSWDAKQADIDTQG